MRKNKIISLLKRLAQAADQQDYKLARRYVRLLNLHEADAPNTYHDAWVRFYADQAAH